MKTQKIFDGIFALHADIKNSRYFEGLWEIPCGVTLNSYIVSSHGVCAMIDLFRDWEDSITQYEAQLSALDMTFKDVNFLILNHLEPDHVAFLKDFIALNPAATIVSTEKGCDLVKNFLHVECNLKAVKDGDELLIGKIPLKFFETPNIHWPETMMTYASEQKILFSCDAFGSYGTVGDNIFSDEISAEKIKEFEDYALEYYANIVASFSSFVNKGLEKLSALPVEVICPSHGLVWRKNCGKIVADYQKYAAYNLNKDALEKEVCLLYSSMYGFTQKGVEAYVKGVESEGVKCTVRRIPDDSLSNTLGVAYRAKAVVIASPTYEYKLFPPMAHVLDLFIRKHFAGKISQYIGSWGWVGGGKREYDSIMETLKWEDQPSLTWQGDPTDDDLKVIFQEGVKMAKLVKG